MGRTCATGLTRLLPAGRLLQNGFPRQVCAPIHAEATFAEPQVRAEAQVLLDGEQRRLASARKILARGDRERLHK